MAADEFQDDGSLIQRIQTGTPAEAAEAFEQLVARHASHLFVHLRSKGLAQHKQEDIANETWLRAWRKISQFRYKGVNLFPWLRKIADFVTKEYFRSRYLEEPLEENSGSEGDLALCDPETLVVQQLSREEIRGAIEQVLQDARQDYRDLIDAKFLGFEPVEIGQLYGWSRSKVDTTTHRAFAWLRQRLLERYGPEIIRDWLA